MKPGRPEVAIFQHMEIEGAGIFPDLLASRGVPAEVHRLDETGEAPAGIDTPLIIMGGAMSVHDEREYPFLAGEKEIIRRYIREGRPVIGICLGAQLIADAAGARVYPGTREFGWCDVYKEHPGYFSGFPGRMKVFQFHGDTFDLPDGAVLLWRGREVRHQMFLLGSAVGVQFHPEITLPLIDAWSGDLPPAALRGLEVRSSRLIPPSHAFCGELVDRFLLGGTR
ncbi:MAG TPA: type 1 glutamine amidotransferase [Methanomicrobiales archaeon]|jgi:GMP synthase-like glutamine amidotransferase|nr:type 1 glutamine amidotransferase [Methanomicrobiales archaeon]